VVLRVDRLGSGFKRIKKLTVFIRFRNKYILKSNCLINKIGIIRFKFVYSFE